MISILLAAIIPLARAQSHKSLPIVLINAVSSDTDQSLSYSTNRIYNAFNVLLRLQNESIISDWFKKPHTPSCFMTSENHGSFWSA